MLRAAAVALVLGLSSVGSQASPRASTSTLVLGEVTVRFDGNPIAKLHADGRTESIGNSKPGRDATFSPGPTLHGDGTIDLTRGGYKARVDADGRIFVVDARGSQQPFGRIVGDQLQMQRGSSGVRVDGARLVEFADGRDTAVIGVIDPQTMKRAALVMTAAFLIDMSIVSAP